MSTDSRVRVTRPRAFRWTDDPVLYDWHSGQPLAANWEGCVRCYHSDKPGFADLETWIDKTSGERAWRGL